MKRRSSRLWPHPLEAPKRRQSRRWSIALLLVCNLAAPLAAADLQVFAAASLSDCLREISADYEKASGDKPVLNLGASSTLARQIQEGAPADLFLSADEAKM